MEAGHVVSPLFNEFDGKGARAHLAPANGFPPQVYAPLIAALNGLFHVRALVPLAMRASSPPPPDLTWHVLADEMGQRLGEAGMDGLVAIGHSLGGVMSILAAIRYPSLFRALILMDPVIFPPHILLYLRVMRLLRQGERFPLVQAARRRRRVFPSREDAARRYRNHRFFQNWHPDAFQAYVRYGLRDRADGQVELAYNPDWEAAIFASVPTDIWRWVPRLRLPVLLLYGERSDTFRPGALKRLRRIWPHAIFIPVPDAGHMFPMEHPEQTAQLIKVGVLRLGLHPSTEVV